MNTYFGYHNRSLCFDTFLMVGVEKEITKNTDTAEKIRLSDSFIRRSLNNFVGVDFLKVEVCMCAYHLNGNHWVLLVCDMRRRSVYCLDSKKKSPDSEILRALRLFQGYIQRVCEEYSAECRASIIEDIPAFDLGFNYSSLQSNG